MLILADGEDVRDLVPPSIRLIHLASQPHSIGEKRNFGAAQATEVICHWDDDDWSAPERLERQIASLTTSGKQVAGFHSMKFTDGEKWWQYEGSANYSLGTSLCYYRTWWERFPFPSKNIGEDNDFVQTAAVAGMLHSENAGDLMHATIHPGNTSPRRVGSNWKAL